MFPLDIRTQTKIEDVLLLVRKGYTLESCMKALQVDAEYTLVLEYELSFDAKPEIGFSAIGWLYEREFRQKHFRRLMEKLKNVEEYREYLKVGKNIFDTWKFSGSKSYMSYIDKIADFTGTSIDFLVRGVEMDGSTFTGAEQELVLRYRKLNEKRQRMIWDLLKDFESLTELDVEK